MRNQKITLMLGIILFPFQVHASFIETTMGAAVLNDATAAYFNPAALMLLKNSQIIPIETIAKFHTDFTGQTRTSGRSLFETGSSVSNSYYNSPSLYFAKPLNNRITLGFAAITNFANRNPEDNGILRYLQSSNKIQDYDLVPSIGIRINNYLSLGAGINFSSTTFDLRPIVGVIGSNIADSQGHNQTTGSGVGANIGFLLQPRAGTLIGCNYRSVTSYQEHGKSELDGPLPITSTNYHFLVRIPARILFSMSQKINSKLTMITTVQHTWWSIIKTINIKNLATINGATPIIVNANIPYYLHNTWNFTLGGNYQIGSDWVVRMAGSYVQSPDDGNNQISTGNSFILGGSLSYKINKTLAIDWGYAHGFIQNQKINIHGARGIIIGNNAAARDSMSLKVTFNL